MSPYQLSDDAKLDFYEALEFISGYSEREAHRWEARMVDAFLHLAKWPLTGLLRTEFGSDVLRFWIEGDYIVVYDPSTTPLSVVCILHGSRDLAGVLAKRMQDYTSNPNQQS